ncbi:hypothetical protein GOV12_04995 [Candidatus Pacearchaeota archaeon]|nr:hypothetical protein [Candidatus Pacearchaeota archaeon]
MELKDIDKPGYLVHGSYLENLSRILKAGGLFPRDSLPERLKPLRFFRRKTLSEDRVGRNGDKNRAISSVVLHDNIYGYKGNLCEPYLWGNPALFHYYIVSNHRFREKSKESIELYQRFGPDLNLLDYPEPYYVEGSEILLVNQGLELDTFVGFVVPTDEMIRSLDDKSQKKIFKSISNGSHKIMSEFDIARKIMDKLKKSKRDDIPIFFFDGDMYGRD